MKTCQQHFQPGVKPSSEFSPNYLSYTMVLLFHAIIFSCAVSHQVVEKLIRGLAMEDSRNMFALFEYNGTTDKAIESRTIVADVLAKFEK